MGDGTGIEWTDATWNPVVGCKAVSPGCDHCYAARQASGRLSGVPVYAGLAKGGVFTGEVRCLPERLDQPLRWRRPRRIFVNSMSDLFHPDVPGDFIEEVWTTMALARQHSFQVLTKRPQRMAKVLTTEAFGACISPDEVLTFPVTHPLPAGWVMPPLPNVWLGTSIESDRYTFRADHLRDTPAAVRFLSLEPLLGPLPSLDLTGIDWVIVGGESGPSARPMHPDWARDIRDRCVEAGVPFLFKQWGEWAPRPAVLKHPFAVTDGELDTTETLTVEVELLNRVGKKAAGRELDGRTWDQYPAPGEPAQALSATGRSIAS